jgi:hypothetical protein
MLLRIMRFFNGMALGQLTFRVNSNELCAWQFVLLSTIITFRHEVASMCSAEYVRAGCEKKLSASFPE